MPVKNDFKRRFLPRLLRRSWHLLATHAPSSVIRRFYVDAFAEGRLRKEYRDRALNFAQSKQGLKLSNDWFSINLPFWLSIIDGSGLKDRDIKALEIGSWEGLSSYFILSEMPRAQLTCVDTWEGGDEHKDGQSPDYSRMKRVEQNFDENLSPFADRLHKFKGTSFSFFNSTQERSAYDFIYVDGSHHSDDVMVDALKCFELLKVGGVMIFDDYFWRHYPRAIDNPAGAINAFLRLKRGSLEIIRVYSQLAVRKTSDRYGR
jgi:predicted O-methyltransferase YrrM